MSYLEPRRVMLNPKWIPHPQQFPQLRGVPSNIRLRGTVVPRKRKLHGLGALGQDASQDLISQGYDAGMVNSLEALGASDTQLQSLSQFPPGSSDFSQQAQNLALQLSGAGKSPDAMSYNATGLVYDTASADALLAAGASPSTAASLVSAPGGALTSLNPFSSASSAAPSTDLATWLENNWKLVAVVGLVGFVGLKVGGAILKDVKVIV